MSKSKPNFFIVGAPKCGTTSLSAYLREHPNVFMCTPKEPHYFATDLPNYRVVDKEDKYLELYNAVTDDHYAVGEASATYLYSKNAISNIKQFNVDAKIIVMLRNPVELVYSMHSSLIFSRDEDELEFARAWELIGQRKKGIGIPEQCRDQKILYYDEIAKLGNQYERVTSMFPPEQTFVIFSEDFFQNTGTVYKKVLKFLNVPDDNRSEFPKINKNRQHKLGWLANFTQRPPKSIANMANKLKTMMGLRRLGVLRTLRKMNATELTRQPLPRSVKEKIIKNYYSDVIKLSNLTGRDLNHWLT